MAVWKSHAVPWWLRETHKVRSPGLPYDSTVSGSMYFRTDTVPLRCSCQSYGPIIKEDYVPLKHLLTEQEGTKWEAWIGQCSNCYVVYWCTVELCGREDLCEYPEDFVSENS